MARASKIRRIFWCWCLSLFLLTFALPVWSAPQSDDIAQAADALEQQIDKAPKFAVEWRLFAARDLSEVRPQLSRRFVDAALEPVRSGQARLPQDVLESLADAAPEEAVVLLPKFEKGMVLLMLLALVRTGHTATAIRMYHCAAAKGLAARDIGLNLAEHMASNKFTQGVTLAREIAASYTDAELEPETASRILFSTQIIAQIEPAAAADISERILKLAVAPGYGAQARPVASGPGPASGNLKFMQTRETVLAEAVSVLRATAPERLAKYKDVAAQKSRYETAKSAGASEVSGAGPVRLMPPLAPPPSPPLNSVTQRLGSMRGQGDDAERTKLIITGAEEVRALPTGFSRLLAARHLCELAAQNDVGEDAMAAAAAVLGEAIRDGRPEAANYVQLANLIRYEHAPVPIQDASLDAAIALLALRDAIRQEADFSLEGMDGNTYTLSSLRGKVVLLNFWSFWYPPCHEVLARLEKLHQEFRPRGLIVLVVSVRDSELARTFAKSPNYTFPFLLDPGRKVQTTFGIDGVPRQSFLFDRQGRIVAQAMDICSERQFRGMLEQVGLY